MGEKKGSGMVGNGDYMLAALKRYFGFDSFRPGQEEAVGTVISGRDVMAVMPTGGGKSVCYQLPAARPGTFTLVVTPLRALMRDQVRHLRSRGIPAALIDSGLGEKERAEVYGRALSGELRIPNACTRPTSPTSATASASACSPSTRRTACCTGERTSDPATCASANSSTPCPRAP